MRTADRPPTPVVRMTGIAKRFPGVLALDGVGLTLRAGEVHALTGENGSGKSTLARILAGAELPDAGTIEVDGEPVELRTPARALRRGIVAISQELALAPTLTVAENISLGRLPRTRSGSIDWRATRRIAREALDALGVDVDESSRVSDLSAELQQEVEIARAVTARSRVLVLDEASSSLSETASARLLQIVEQVSGSGVAVLMISHRLADLYAVARRATVLRDGRVVDVVALPETPESELVRLMVGRELGDLYGSRRAARGEVVLSLDRLASPGDRLRPTSFDVHAGEIVGVAGLVGSGKAELGLCLGGAIGSSGAVRVRGAAIDLTSPRAAIAGGIGLVPADRKRSGLLSARSVRENLSVVWMRELSRAGVVDVRRERRMARSAMNRFGVRARSTETCVATLSGGNQQKIVLGRWLAIGADVLVLVEPTRGIDVGAKSEIYRMIREVAASGAAIVLISSELPELLGVAHRILVMFGGEVRASFDAATADEEAIAHVAVAGTPIGAGAPLTRP